MQERIKYLDATKAICMLLVVLGHCSWTESIPHLSGAIYSFHMPAFFIVSGFFVRKLSIKEAWKKYSKAYLLPYALTCALCLCSVALLAMVGSCDFWESLKESIVRFAWGSGWHGGDAIFSAIPAVGYMWFLLALFWACLLFSNIEYYVSSEFRKCLLIVLIAIISRLSVGYIRLPLSIQAGAFALLFVYSGSLIKKYDIIDKISKLPLLYYLPLIIVCTLHLLKCQTILQTGKVMFDSFGIVTTLLVCCSMMALIKAVDIKGGWLGKNTLLFLCGHAMFNYVGFYSDIFSFASLPYSPGINVVIEFAANVLTAYVIAILLSMLPIFRNRRIK